MYTKQFFRLKYDGSYIRKVVYKHVDGRTLTTFRKIPQPTVGYIIDKTTSWEDFMPLWDNAVDSILADKSKFEIENVVEFEVYEQTLKKINGGTSDEVEIKMTTWPISFIPLRVDTRNPSLSSWQFGDLSLFSGCTDPSHLSTGYLSVHGGIAFDTHAYSGSNALGDCVLKKFSEFEHKIGGDYRVRNCFSAVPDSNILIFASFFGLVNGTKIVRDSEFETLSTIEDLTANNIPRNTIFININTKYSDTEGNLIPLLNNSKDKVISVSAKNVETSTSLLKENNPSDINHYQFSRIHDMEYQLLIEPAVYCTHKTINSDGSPGSEWKEWHSPLEDRTFIRPLVTGHNIISKIICNTLDASYGEWPNGDIGVWDELLIPKNKFRGEFHFEYYVDVRFLVRVGYSKEYGSISPMFDSTVGGYYIKKGEKLQLTLTPKKNAYLEAIFKDNISQNIAERNQKFVWDSVPITGNTTYYFKFIGEHCIDQQLLMKGASDSSQHYECKYFEAYTTGPSLPGGTADRDYDFKNMFYPTLTQKDVKTGGLSKNFYASSDRHVLISIDFSRSKELFNTLYLNSVSFSMKTSKHFENTKLRIGYAKKSLSSVVSNVLVADYEYDYVAALPQSWKTAKPDVPIDLIAYPFIIIQLDNNREDLDGVAIAALKFDVSFHNIVDKVESGTFVYKGK